MDPVLGGAAIAVSVLILVYLYRVFLGPTVYDRLIGLGGVSNKAVALILLIGAGQGRLEMFVDIALAYILLNLVGALAAARFLEKPKWTRS